MCILDGAKTYIALFEIYIALLSIFGPAISHFSLWGTTERVGFEFSLCFEIGRFLAVIRLFCIGMYQFAFIQAL